MIYRPEKHSLWDTTVFHDGERLHLFYIAGEGYPGHAVSEDGVRWETRESLDLHGPEGSWNEKGVI